MNEQSNSDICGVNMAGRRRYSLVGLNIFLQENWESKVSLPFLIFNFETTVSRAFTVGSCLTLLSLASLSYTAFRDYSKFFPSTYEMEVFFDDKGIEQSFQVFSPDEYENLKIDKDWKKKKMEYLSKLNKAAIEKLGISDFFNLSGKYVHSKGQSNFFVEKSKGVWQQYHIKEAYGDLTHFVEQPGQPKKQIKSKFELLNSSDNYISLELADIYVKFVKIMKPQFKQYAVLGTSMSGDRTLYHHCIVTITKIRFFPIVNFGNTIYCIQSNDRSGVRLVPIGYAVYSPR